MGRGPYAGAQDRLAAEQLQWRARARRDLVQHVAYLFHHAGDQTAYSFRAVVDEALERLLRMPEIGALKATQKRYSPPIRMWAIPRYSEYLIFYQALDSGIRIVRILHAKRDYTRLL